MKYKPYEITVESVYGRPEPTIPYGFEDTGDFRPPREDEEYLTITGTRGISISEDSSPRIILRRKKRKQIILTEVGVGTPKEGQYWEDRLGQRVLYMAQEDKCDSLFGTPTTIYEREDKEI